VVNIHVRGLATVLLSALMLARDKSAQLTSILTPPLLFDMLTAQIGLDTFKANVHDLLLTAEVSDVDDCAAEFSSLNLAAVLESTASLPDPSTAFIARATELAPSNTSHDLTAPEPPSSTPATIGTFFYDRAFTHTLRVIAARLDPCLLHLFAAAATEALRLSTANLSQRTPTAASQPPIEQMKGSVPVPAAQSMTVPAVTVHATAATAIATAVDAATSDPDSASSIQIRELMAKSQSQEAELAQVQSAYLTMSSQFETAQQVCSNRPRGRLQPQAYTQA